MEEITGNEADKAKEQYENLVIELIKEEDLLPSQRNQDYFDVTLKLFLDRGLSPSDHTSWRTKKMVSEMRSLLCTLHKTKNPWKYEEYIHVNTPWPDAEEPISPEEFPEFNRQELEILAAQEFLFQALGNVPKDNNTGETLQPKPKNKETNTIVIKRRKGNLEDLEAIDLLQSGLSAQQIVNHWKEQNPDKIKEDEELDDSALLDKLSQAASRAKTRWERKHGNAASLAASLPLRIQCTIRSDWHKYALTKEGRSGAGGGNKYGIIKDEKNI